MRFSTANNNNNVSKKFGERLDFKSPQKTGHH